MKVGIVGHGFVGKAVEYGFTHPKVETKVVDPIYGTTARDLGPCDVVFVCVPTPMGDDGKINASILESVMSFLDDSYLFPLVVIKSTITPDIATRYQHSRRRGVVYNPEFLREKTAGDDFVNPSMHVFGGYEEDVDLLERIYKEYSLCRPCPVFKMTAQEASYVKYAINSFLSVKVTFFNQLYDAAVSDNANFTSIINAVGNDPRIGYSHTRVPGFDGKRGFGGSCFPKDTSALVNFTDKMSLVEETIRINNQYRSRYEVDEREKQQNISFGTS